MWSNYEVVQRLEREGSWRKNHQEKTQPAEWKARSCNIDRWRKASVSATSLPPDVEYRYSKSSRKPKRPTSTTVMAMEKEVGWLESENIDSTETTVYDSASSLFAALKKSPGSASSLPTSSWKAERISECTGKTPTRQERGSFLQFFRGKRAVEENVERNSIKKKKHQKHRGTQLKRTRSDARNRESSKAFSGLLLAA
jgi:hypothetical protein